MSSASSTVTYTSVDTDSEPGRAFWPVDEELSDGEPIYPEHIPLEDEHVFPAEEQLICAEEEEEEHLAPADSIVAPVVDHVPSSEETEPFETDESAPTPRSPQTIARIAEYAVAPTPPSPSPPPSPLSPWSSPLPQIPSPPLPPLPSSLHLPPQSTIREDTPEAELPLVRVCADTALTSRLIMALSDLDAKADDRERWQVGYGIRDTWVDLRETTEEIAPVTLEGVNTRDRQTQMYQTVETLVDDGRYHYETARLLDQEALVSREAWVHSMGFSSAVHFELQGYKTHGHMATALGEIWALQEIDVRARRSCLEGTGKQHATKRTARTVRTARVAAATATAAAAATLMTTATIEQLVADRVSTGTEGVVVLSQWFERIESVFHISNCAPENQVKFATCTFIGNALTWWNSHKKAVTQEVAYAMDWKALKKLMTVKYCPRGEIKKLEIELWNLKVKGTDIPSYTLRFQELALMCGRMFPEESDEVEKYVSGLPDLIRGNVMSYRPQIMEEVIKFANDQMNQKLITISERQAEQKRKIESNAGTIKWYQHKINETEPLGELTLPGW
ncbi:reverse transcriptase domain-containing protein [Tanacetum coccineum]